MANLTKSPWFRTAAAEASYSRDLQKIAREVGRISTGFDVEQPGTVPLISRLLTQYAEIVEPWAEARAARLIVQVNQQNERAWANARKMAGSLKRELMYAPTGQLVRATQAEQVVLIKSLPLEAAQRAQRLVTENRSGAGARSSYIAEEIARTGLVTKSRAKLIARTETSKLSTNLVMARSLSIGGEGYIFRTSRDGDVRPSHKAMEGKYVRWDSPPTLDGMVGHAGCFPNCRCFPEPVIPSYLFGDEDDE